MSTFHPFISYSRQNSPTAQLVQVWINEIDGVTAHIDNSDLRPTSPIGEGILQILNNSDCVVLILTDEAMQSNYVREELVRAHDRGLKIVKLIDKELSRDIERELPWFIRDLAGIPFSKNSVQEIKDKLQKEILRIKQEAQNTKCHLILQKLQSILPHESFYDVPYKISLVQNILDLAEHEIKGIQDDNYNTELAEELNFLTRAFPLFEKADRVYAVSLDLASTFWLDAKTKGIATNYIRHQKPNTMRLFVFSSPEILQRHGKVLDAHNQQYGKNGTDGLVLVTSFSHYTNKLLRKFLNNYDAGKSRFSKSDFGILEYDVNGVTTTLEAVLSERKLQFNRLRPGFKGEIKGQEVKRFFEEQQKLERGHFNQSLGILRWDHSIWDKGGYWAEVLKQLFERRSEVVQHVIFFSRRE